MAQNGKALYNSFQLPSSAREVVWVDGALSIQKAIDRAMRFVNPPKVLGGGSNVLLPDYYDGSVIKVALKSIEKVYEGHESVCIEVGGGGVWHDLVAYCVSKKWYGIENLALIPGSVGAAPIQNIGAYGVCLADVFLYCWAWDMQKHCMVCMHRDACDFQYRSSVFKSHPGRWIILKICLKLSKKPHVNDAYFSLKSALSHIPDAFKTPEDVFAAVIAIRSKKFPQHGGVGSCGSMFMNFDLDHDQYNRFFRHHPGLHHHFDEKSKRVKLFAGNILQLAGWGGYYERGLGFCLHNPIVMHHIVQNQATQIQVLGLIDRVKASVKSQFGLDLKVEPEVISA